MSPQQQALDAARVRRSVEEREAETETEWTLFAFPQEYESPADFRSGA